MEKILQQKSDLLDFIRESADHISNYCTEFQAEMIGTANGRPPEFPSYDVSVLETHHYHLEVLIEKLRKLENQTKNPACPEKVNGVSILN